MNTIKTILLFIVACLCIFALSIFYYHFCSAMPANAQNETEPVSSKKNQKQETKPQSSDVSSNAQKPKRLDTVIMKFSEAKEKQGTQLRQGLNIEPSRAQARQRQESAENTAERRAARSRPERERGYARLDERSETRQRQGSAEHTAVRTIARSNREQSVDTRVEPSGAQARQRLYTDWWQISALADKLIDDKKFDEAEKMLNSILPQARKEAPESLDYALTLCRLSTDLYALKKYPQALARIQEAIAIVSDHRINVDQRRIMWRCLGTKVAILLSLKKNAQAEALARKTIAYAIAFPNVATTRQIKIAYMLLNKALEAQKKFEEAKKMNEIMN